MATLIAQGAAAGAVVARQSSPQSHAPARGRGTSSSDAGAASDDISSSDSERGAAPAAWGEASAAVVAKVELAVKEGARRTAGTLGEDFQLTSELAELECLRRRLERVATPR